MKAVFERDPWFPAEEAPGFGDVGAALLGVARGSAFRNEFDPGRVVGESVDEFGKLED